MLSDIQFAQLIMVIVLSSIDIILAYVAIKALSSWNEKPLSVFCIFLTAIFTPILLRVVGLL
jgi:hypothetical protein